ncbi:MAG: hypothetical protein U0270_38140 [Labilithrix sp.]
MRARALLAGGGALLTGCSLLLAGELDDAREVAVLADGGGSSSSGGPSEAGAGESGAEGGADGSALRGCKSYQPAPKFCADFDGDAGLDDWHVDDENGEATIQSVNSLSPPSAARVTVNDLPDGCKYSRLDRDFKNIGDSPRITVTAWMRLESPWPSEMIPFVIDTQANGTDEYCAALFFVASKNGKPTSAHIDVQSKVIDDHHLELDGFPSADAWSQIKVVISKRANGGAIYETTFMDANGFTVSNTNEFPECKAWANVGIHLGAHCDHRGAAVSFDDVRVDWE